MKKLKIRSIIFLFKRKFSISIVSNSKVVILKQIIKKYSPYYILQIEVPNRELTIKGMPKEEKGKTSACLLVFFFFFLSN